MKKLVFALSITTLLLCACFAVPVVFPLTTLRLCLNLADEIQVEKIATLAIEEVGQKPVSTSSPKPISFRGRDLNQMKLWLQVQDAKGFYCFCTGDYQFTLKCHGLSLASFRGHLAERPSRLIGSLGKFTLQPQKAAQLLAFLKKQRLSPRLP